MDNLSELLEKGYGLSHNPTYHYNRCMWSGTDGTECNDCAAACPEGVFPLGKLKKSDYAKCSKCGLCAAICPTKAIAPPAIRVRSFLKALSSDEAVSIACPRDEGRFSLRIDCLAALSWEEIACAALKNGVILSLRRCQNCPEKALFGRLMDTLNCVRRFLGDDVFFDRVQLLEENDDYVIPSGHMSRRELFSIYKKLDLDRTNRLLPSFDPKKDHPALFYRALLREIVQEKRNTAGNDKPTYVMALPSVNDRCYNCGVCTRACADRALSFRPAADGKSFIAVVDVWKCTGCGCCVKACREKALNAPAEMRLSQLGPVSVGRCTVHLCSVCGKTRKPSDTDGLCGFCRIRKQAAENRIADGRN